MAEEREIKDLGIVLKSIDSGEADRLVTILTSTHGKITAKMRGVKKAKAKLAFASFPLNLGEYIFVKRGRNYTVINCSYIDNFASLTADLNLFYAANGILEGTNHLARDGYNSYELFMVVLKSLKVLAYTKEVNILKVLAKTIVEFLKISGFNISVDNLNLEAAGCYFDFERGMLCKIKRDEIIELSKEDGEVLQTLIEQDFDSIDYSQKCSKTILKLLVLFFENKTDEELKIIKQFL